MSLSDWEAVRLNTEMPKSTEKILAALQRDELQEAVRAFAAKHNIDIEIVDDDYEHTDSGDLIVDYAPQEEEDV